MWWFLTIHIIALLFWCAALLYLPALIATSHSGQEYTALPAAQRQIVRFVFNNVASPAALLAIAAGTVVFLLNHSVALWLLIKLTLVAVLTVVHALLGFLLLRLESRAVRAVRLWCGALALVLLALMVAIIWIVLAKPDLGLLL